MQKQRGLQEKVFVFHVLLPILRDIQSVPARPRWVFSKAFWNEDPPASAAHSPPLQSHATPTASCDPPHIETDTHSICWSIPRKTLAKVIPPFDPILGHSALPPRPSQRKAEASFSLLTENCSQALEKMLEVKNCKANAFNVVLVRWSKPSRSAVSELWVTFKWSQQHVTMTAAPQPLLNESYSCGYTS